MGYKITNSSSSFVDITLSETLKHNRSLQNMDKLNKSIDWEKIKSILSCHYIHGTSNEGASAYHPILLYKCLLLQKWFRIQSDPELESQINDRLSFKRFLGLPFETPSPDHSAFSRFRARLSKEAMDQINMKS
jgi:IS5 family transposase